MLIPPDSLPGWKVFTVGDDIAWLHPGADGRLWAINPEAGYFGVVPGTNAKTNRNAYEMIRRDTIFTNVALTADNEPWWEGRGEGAPAIDWQGRPYDPANGPAAHPNSRFTVAAAQNPAYSPRRGGPARRADLGADLRRPPARARAAGLRGPQLAARRAGRRIGRLRDHRRRRRPGRRGAPRPDGDEAVLRLQLRRLLGALAQGRRRTQAPAAHLPRQLVPAETPHGKFLWPGFGDNLRVLAWILDRCSGRAGAVDTADRPHAAPARISIPAASTSVPRRSPS